MSETEKKNLEISIEAMLPRITEQIAAELKTKAMQRFEYQVTEAVGKAIASYITENIVPHVAKEMASHDAEIRAAVVMGIAQAAEALREKIVTSATAKITGYDGEKLIQDFVSKVLGRGY